MDDQQQQQQFNYAWEEQYQRSWDLIQEDAQGMWIGLNGWGYYLKWIELDGMDGIFVFCYALLTVGYCYASLLVLLMYPVPCCYCTVPCFLFTATYDYVLITLLRL